MSATTALNATLARLRQRLPRTALVMLLLCTGIALLLNDFMLRGLGTKAVYSFAIGGCCWVLSETGTLLQAAGSDVLRRLRGLPLSAGGHDAGWQGQVAATLAGIVTGLPAGTHIADLLTGHRSPPMWDLGTPNARFGVVFAFVGSAVVIGVISSTERLARARAQAEAAQRLASDTQLRLLQSQLEPHMLFNTLANLRVLIGLDAVRAQAMLDHLIAFLRATLQASRAGSHPLASEFERTADYLALMAMRMGPRLQVHLDLPDPLRALAVPPLLLQPLVENSIQHGLEPQVQGGRVHVAARRDGHTLVLTVRDTGVGHRRSASHAGAAPAAGPGRAERRPGGFGLAGTRERLLTLYGGRASLQLADADDADGGTLATVRLPLVAAEPAQDDPATTNPDGPAAARAPAEAAPATPAATTPCPPSAP